MYSSKWTLKDRMLEVWGCGRFTATRRWSGNFVVFCGGVRLGVANSLDDAFDKYIAGGA